MQVLLLQNIIVKFILTNMSDKDLNILIELAQEKLKKGVSREEALNSFIAAGILNDKGEYTEPYKELEAIVA